MSYDWKPLEEVSWLVFVAVAVQALQALVIYDPSKIADPKAWAVALGAGCVRAAAGAALGWFTRPQALTPPPPRG